jgi:hypothetical protein
LLRSNYELRTSNETWQRDHFARAALRLIDLRPLDVRFITLYFIMVPTFLFIDIAASLQAGRSLSSIPVLGRDPRCGWSDQLGIPIGTSSIEGARPVSASGCQGACRCGDHDDDAIWDSSES